MYGMTSIEWAASLYRKSSSENRQKSIGTEGSFQTQVEKAEESSLTKEQEMELFQREFWQEVARIPKTHTLNQLAIRITDAGWERMKAEPEYREEMLSLIRRDTTGHFIGPTDEIITIGASDKEYRASGWSAEKDDFYKKVDKDSYIERKKKRQKKLKEYQEQLWQQHFYRHKLLIEGREGARNPFYTSNVCDLYESLIPFL